MARGWRFGDVRNLKLELLPTTKLRLGDLDYNDNDYKDLLISLMRYNVSGE